MRARLRWLSALTLVIYIFTLTAPILHAQFVYDFDDNSYSNSSPDELRDNVYSTMSEKERLEKSILEQRQRQLQTRASIKQLQEMQVPPGFSPSEWGRMIKERVRELEVFDNRNQSLIERTKAALTDKYEKLKNFKAFYSKHSSDPRYKGVGTLLGVTGYTVVPPWQRPVWNQNGQGVLPTLKNIGNHARLKTVNVRIGADGNSGIYGKGAAFHGNLAAKHSALAESAGSTKVVWEPTVVGEGASARYVLKAKYAEGNYGSYAAKTVKTDIPAYKQTSSGEWVQNPAAKRQAMDIASLRTSNTKYNLAIAKLKHQAAKAPNQAIANRLNKQITKLQKQQAELNESISAYESQNPSLGAKAKALAGNAAKWAAMSVAVTYGANVVSELANNGWDLRNVHWKEHGRFLKSKEFWGGTGGSFAGSMLGSLIGSALPGGPFVRIGLAVAGAGMGWTLGSGGSLKDMDWVQFGATTVGSTIGMMAMAWAGPLGMMVGGIVGNLVADWVLRKLREWGTAPVMSSARPAYSQSSYGPYSSSGYNQGSYDNQYQSQEPDIGGNGYGNQAGQGSSSDQAARLGNEKKSLQRDLLAAMRKNPPDMQTIQAIHQQLQQIDRQINSIRSQAAQRHYGYR